MRFDFERTDDPALRCEICHFKAIEGTNRCPRHGANKMIEAQQRQHTYNLKRDEVRRRVNLLAADPNRLRLDEELGILRLTLEETINKLTEDGDLSNLFTHSDTIANLVTRIEKLVLSCGSQAQKLKLLMTAEDFVDIVEVLMNIVADEVGDYDVVATIGNRIGEALSSQFNGKQSAIESCGEALQLDE